MTLSELRDLNDATLGGKLTYIAGQIVLSPSTYGLTVPQGTQLSDIAELFATSLVDMEAARGVFDGAMEAKENLRESALEMFGQLLSVMYAQPAVTPEAISGLTLTPRSGVKVPITPVEPANLVATPSANGTVRLSWRPNGNKYGVIYEIEAADADESNWTVISTTTKTKITLSGFAPGTPKWFRVRATKNGLVSEFSFNAGIYIPIPGESMEAAA